MGTVRSFKERVLFFIIFFILVLCIIHIKRSSQNFTAEESTTIKLPKFKSLDINNNLITEKTFNNQNIFACFIDDSSKVDVWLLRDVIEQREKYNLQIIAIPKNIIKFSMNKNIDLSEITVLKDYQSIKKLFNSPVCCETFHLYNSEHFLVSTNKNHVGAYEGIGKFLNEIKHDKEEIFEFIPINRNINEISWLIDLYQLISERGKKFYLVTLFIKICDTCVTGSILRILNELQAKYITSLDIFAFLPQTYSMSEIKILKEQYSIKYQMIQAFNKLEEKWQYTRLRFSEKYFSDLMFVINNEGNIILRFDKLNSNLKMFFKSIETLLKEESSE